MKLSPAALRTTITVPPKPQEGSSGPQSRWEAVDWLIAAVVTVLLGVVLLAVFHHWVVGRQFKQRRKTAELAAKTRPRRYSGDQVPPRRGE